MCVVYDFGVYVCVVFVYVSNLCPVFTFLLQVTPGCVDVHFWIAMKCGGGIVSCGDGGLKKMRRYSVKILGLSTLSA